MLLEEGNCVAVIDLQDSTTTSRDFLNNLPGRRIFFQGDVRSDEEIKSAVNEILTTFGRLDVCINCAGIMKVQRIYNGQTKEIHSLSSFQDMIDVNACGTFNVCRLAVEAMVQSEANAEGQRGIIINTSSVAGLDGLTSTVAYAASKAAVAGMTLPLARELGCFGIRVLCIAPGPFKTPLVKESQDMRSLIDSVAFPNEQAFQRSLPNWLRPSLIIRT